MSQVCRKEALVQVDMRRTNDGKLVCNNCMHSETAADLVRYRTIVRRNCDNCGKEFETTVPGQKKKVDEITIACPHCGTVRIYKPKHEEYKLGYDNKGQVSDPIFNLPLWFQANVRGDLFWAYNRDHLSEIKAYVTSKLRETHTTMVERLPNFIKDAKNRDTLVKVIERLERKTGA
jgi:DNA-directed RNA polymerase subunit RPC12/RpoP